MVPLLIRESQLWAGGDLIPASPPQTRSPSPPPEGPPYPFSERRCVRKPAPVWAWTAGKAFWGASRSAVALLQESPTVRGRRQGAGDGRSPRSLRCLFGNMHRLYGLRSTGSERHAPGFPWTPGTWRRDHGIRVGQHISQWSRGLIQAVPSGERRERTRHSPPELTTVRANGRSLPQPSPSRVAVLKPR